MSHLSALFAGIRSRLKEDSGVTLIEVMVTLFIFAILTTVLWSAVMSGSSSLKAVRQTSDLNEESRLVLNRMGRELRQATRISGVVNPDATNADGSHRVCEIVAAPCFNPGLDSSLTIEVDFNSDGFFNVNPALGDVEKLTYRYDRPNSRLLLETPGSPAVPILAGNVSGFKLSYRSSNYNCDINSDGQVTWQEIETAQSPPCPVGAGTPNSLLDTELSQIDQVVVDLTVLTPPRQQQYRTKIDLRNRA